MDRQALRNFWENKAGYYPLPFEHQTFTQTKRIIERIKAYGASFSGKTVLDIGCGTGVYTLPVAKEASFVMGLDCSEKMLSILQEEARKAQLPNVAVLNMFFQDAHPSLFGDRFDIVMAMMTPAIRSKRDILAMEDLSKEWLIYMGWGKKRKNLILDEVLSLHGVQMEIPSGALNICMILEGLQRRFHFELFETSWSFKGSLEDAAADLSHYVELYGKTPKMEAIHHVLARYRMDGLVEHRTEAEVGLILWRKGG
jgi:SAM-dependent methyltransferase